MSLTLEVAICHRTLDGLRLTLDHLGDTDILLVGRQLDALLRDIRAARRLPQPILAEVDRAIEHAAGFRDPKARPK